MSDATAVRPAIEVAGLTKRFGTLTAVDGLSFTVPAGQVTGFLGPNGAGKTTTMRIVLGLAAATEGETRVLGVPYAALDRPVSRVGAMLESSGFHPGRTGRRHLSIAAAQGRIDRRRVDEVLDQVAMGAYADRRVGGYSSGMRQRLGLATALLGDPDVLVLDEPGNGLDPAGVAWLRGFLRAFADAGRTVFVSSHLLAEIGQTVDRLVVIDHGRLVREGSVDAITSAVAAHVIVRSPDHDRLAAALREQGAVVTLDDRDAAALSVSELSIERVGEVAQAEGVVLHELRSREASLEEAFLQLTGDEGAGEPAPPPVPPPPPGAGIPPQGPA